MEFPPCGWIKLNVASSSKGNPSDARCSWIIRDDTGRLMGAFSYHLGVCFALTTKLQGIFIGLEWVWNLKINKVILECDSSTVVSMITIGLKNQQVFNKLVKRICAWIDKDQDVEVIHSIQESNHCVDWLGNKSLELKYDLHVQNEPPRDLAEIVHADVSEAPFFFFGQGFQRLV